MLKHALILLTLALAQFGCSPSGENTPPYDIAPMTEEARIRLETNKRELLQLEDIAVGTGAVAASGRRLTADVEVRYMNGTVVYRGTVITAPGFNVDVENNMGGSKLLNTGQEGITLGLNGMAVGGRRRMTIDRKLVCTHLLEGDPFGIQCKLIGRTFKDEVIVRKETLVVEATLTDSCRPVVVWQGLYMFGGYMLHWHSCRHESFPQITPGAPIWRYYY